MDLLNNFLRFFLPFFILVTVGALYSYNEEVEAEQLRLLTNLQDRAVIGTAALNRSLENTALDLHVLVELAQLTDTFNVSSDARIDKLEQVFLTFSLNKGIYDQIRWIDKSGQEQVRVNHSHGQSELIPPAQLQNKKGRYYFEQTMLLDKDQFFISPLDLNVEQGQVERPFKPVIRLATPVFDIAGNKRGIVLINYSGLDLLQHFLADQPDGAGSVELLNQAGFWLHSHTPNRAWGFMFNRQDTYAGPYPDSWSLINRQDQGELINHEGIFVFHTVTPLQQISTRWGPTEQPELTSLSDQNFHWKVVAHIEPQVLSAIKLRCLIWVSAIALLLLLLGLLGGYFYARSQYSQTQMLANTLRLRERETLLTRLGEGVFGLDKQGHCTFINPKACELLGYDGPERIERTLFERLSQQLDLSELLQHPQEPSDTRVRTVEATLYRQDGSEFAALLTLSPLFDEQQHVSGAVIAFQDISDRRRSEMELQEAITALDNEHQFMKTLIETLPDMIWMKDTEGRYLTCNPEFERFIGQPESAILGKTDTDLVSPELADHFHDSDQQALMQGQQAVVQEWVKYIASDQKALFRTTKTPMRDNRGKIIGVLGIGHDITDLREAEQRLMLQAQVLDQIQDRVTVTDLDGHILYINAAQANELNCGKDRIIGHKITILNHTPEADITQQDIIEQTRQKGEWQGEVRQKSCTGDDKYMDLRTTLVLDNDHNPVAMVGVSTDITDRKTYQQQLEHFAHFDQLTGLPNRMLLTDRLQQAMAQTVRSDTLLATVFIDLDGFKAVNDTYGHAQGDFLLQQLAQRIKTLLRQGDTLARVGGDEFIAVLQGLHSTADVAPVLTRILNDVAAPVISDNHTLQVSASIGVSFFSQTEQLSLDQLISQADDAMYSAKQQGKNQYAIHTAYTDKAYLLTD